MRINHNIASMSTQGALFRVNRDLNKSVEKLSTGLRINSAADDAAGLGVSENLRTQVRGLGQALKNQQDVIALLNIADGAMNEQANILQRMRELVIQARNDTLTSTERSYIHQEFSGLISEVDRIAASTKYNGMQLFATPEVTKGTETYTSSSPTSSPHTIADGRQIWDNAASSIFGANDYSSAHYFNMFIGANYTAGDAAAFNNSGTRQSWDKSAEDLITIQLGQMDANAILTCRPGLATNMGDASDVFNSFNWNSANVGGDAEDRFLSIAYHGAPGRGSVQTKLQFLLDTIDGKTENIPNSAVLKGANQNVTGLERISTMRANLGALINRMEHTVNNTINQINNQQSAESTIRDTNFASETMDFTRSQILSQSATAMLAQSNMTPQSMLQLLG